MGLMQKRKGSRTEREFARLIGGQRVPLSGAAKHAGREHSGDVVGLGLRWECKARRDGFKQLYQWLEGADALAVKADRKEWLVVMPVSRFLEMIQQGGEKHACCTSGESESGEGRICKGCCN